MNLLLIAVVLALIQPVHFILEYLDSKRNNRFHLLKNHKMDFYLDWIFLPFNFLLVFAVSINLKSLLILILISVVLNIAAHFYWIKVHGREKKEVYMFDYKTKKTHFSGYVHIVFSIIEAVLIALFLFSPALSYLYSIGIILLVAFFISTIIHSKFSHGKINPVDLFFSALVLGFIAFRVFFKI